MKDPRTDGWLNKNIITYFTHYADFCFRTFGHKVKHWITFNEPESFTWLGYGVGIHAPGRCSSYMNENCVWVAGGGNSGTEPYITAHNVILSHAYAVKQYRENYQAKQGGVIGMCTQSEYGEPWDSTVQADTDVIETKLEFEFGWYNDPLYFGKYPDVMRTLVTDNRLPEFTTEEAAIVKGSYDFLGLNHYTSKFIHYSGEVGRDWGSDGRFWESSTDKNNNLIGPYADADWLNVYPIGLRKLLVWIDKRYSHPPIYVFENGVCVPGEGSLSIVEA